MTINVQIELSNQKAVKAMREALEAEPFKRNFELDLHPLMGELSALVLNAITDICQELNVDASVHVGVQDWPPTIYSLGGPHFPCPKCGQEMDHYRNYDRNHYGVCLNCWGYFIIGSNLFSSWKEETQEEWDKNAAYLSQFQNLDLPVPSDEVSF